MRRTTAVALAFALSSVACSSFAQKAAIAVSATASDDVGGRLAYAIREGIRRSAGLRLVDRTEDAAITLRLVTLNPDERRGFSSQTVYSVVWTASVLGYGTTKFEGYVSHSVGHCGSSKVQECADGLVADTDQEAQNMRAAMRDALERLKK